MDFVSTKADFKVANILYSLISYLIQLVLTLTSLEAPLALSKSLLRSTSLFIYN
jgi:hypothetical protein